MQFAGWSYTPDGVVAYKAGDTISLRRNTNLYAVWEMKDTVSLTYWRNWDVDDKTKSGSYLYFVGETAEVMPNSFEAPTGYEFVGWNTAADGTGDSYTVDSIIVLGKDTDLYAQWEKQTYTLTYHENAGHEEEATVAEAYKYKEEATIIGEPDSFTAPEGKVFLGWNPWPAAQVPSIVFDPLNPEKFEVTGNVDLYAVWGDVDTDTGVTENVVLRYDYNTGSGFMMPEVYDVNETVTVKENGFTAPEGKVFIGWSEDADAKVATVQPGEMFQIRKDTVLYAIWDDANPAEKYVLIYHANDGTDRMYADPAYPEGYDYDETVMIKSVGDCEFNALGNKVFAGWSTTKDGKVLVQPEDLFQIRENTDLYAVWNKEHVDVNKELANKNDKSYRRGEWVEYVITVTNNGDFDLKDIVVVEKPDDDVFSKWEFTDYDSDDNVKVTFNKDKDEATIKEIKVGESVDLYFRAKVASDAKKNADLVNIVVVEDENGKDLGEDKNDDGYVYVPSGGGGSHKPSKPSKPVPPALNGDDHFQYVQGYPDGTVGPERNITRAEATVIFFRLLKDNVREEYLDVQNTFPDVRLADWFNVGVSTMENGNFVSGYEDGYFRPNGYITRAELAVIISNFDDLEASDNTRFADARGHWAEKYINSAAEKGWISGYDDGLFRPNQFITRAETMSMINRVLQRRVDADGLHKDAHQWRDNKPGKWYYYDVLEATNHHDYERADDELVENWTAINPDKIWEN